MGPLGSAAVPPGPPCPVCNGPTIPLFRTYACARDCRNAPTHYRVALGPRPDAAGYLTNVLGSQVIRVFTPAGAVTVPAPAPGSLDSQRPVTCPCLAFSLAYVLVTGQANQLNPHGSSGACRVPAGVLTIEPVTIGTTAAHERP